MTNRSLSSAWVNEKNESTKVDKIWKYLERLFDPREEPNGIFLYDREDTTTDVSGATLFSKVIESEAYNAFAEVETDLFEENKHAIIGSYTQKKTTNIVDMGPGDGIKSAKVLSSTLGKRLEGNTYIPVDISPWFIQHAANEVQHHLQSKQHIRIKTAWVTLNFLESNATLKDISNKMYFFLGGSIGNFSDEEIVRILENMAAERGKKNNIILSFFTSPDKESEDYAEQIQKLCAAYGDPDTSNTYYNAETSRAIEKWVMEGFHSLGVDTSKLEFFVRYDETNTRMVLGAKVKETVTVKHNGKIYTKETGDELLAIQSKRFTRSKLYNLAEQANVSVQKIETLDHMGMAILESDRTLEAKGRRKKNKNRAIKTAIAATLLTGAIKGGMEYEKHKQEKQRQDDLTEVLHHKLEWKEYSSGYYGNLNDEVKTEVFTKKVDEFFEVLFQRYDLQEVSTSKQEFIKVILSQRLMNQDESAINITILTWSQGAAWYPNHTYEKIAELIENFIDENTYILTANDIRLHLHSSLLPYEEALKNTLESNENISQPQWFTTTQIRGGLSTYRWKYKRIGPYTTANGNTYIACKYEKDNKEYIIGCPALVQGDNIEEKEEWISKYKEGSLDAYFSKPELGKNNMELFPELTLATGKIIAQDYYQKPYFNKLTGKIAHITGKDPAVLQYNAGTLISYLTHRSKEWYDFSWLINSKNEKDIEYFTHTYLQPILYKSNSASEHDKSNAINNIFDVAVNKYLKSIKENVYEDPQGAGKLKGAIFHRLCSKELFIQSVPSIQKWINENEDIFAPFMNKDAHTRINPEESSILSQVTSYHKKDASDIKSNPGLLNIKIFLYQDLEWNEYEVALYEGNLYARYVMSEDEANARHSLSDNPQYIEQLQNKLIAWFKKEWIGIWSKEVMAKQKENRGTSMEAWYIDQSNEMYIRNNITSKLYAHNTEIGNIVLQDYRKRKKYWLGGKENTIIAPH